MKKTFSTPEVREVLKVGKPNFHSWVANGYIVPSIKKAAGSGDPAIWSYYDIISAKVFQKLTQHGMARDLAAGLSKRVVNRFKMEMINTGIEALWFNFYFETPERVAYRIERVPPLKKETPVSEYNRFPILVGVNMMVIEAEVREAVKKM